MIIDIDSKSPFSEIYESLTEDGQNLLKLVSIVYGAVQYQNICRCLNRAGLKNGRGLAFRKEDIPLVLDDLKQKNLITIDKYDGVICHLEYMEEATARAVFDGSFDILSKAVESELPIARGWYTGHSFKNYNEALRPLRIAFYRRESITKVWECMNEAIQYGVENLEAPDDPLLIIFLRPLNRSLLLYLPEEVSEVVFSRLFNILSPLLYLTNNLMAVFLEARNRSIVLRESTVSTLLFQYILRGRFKEASKELIAPESAVEWTYAAFFSLMGGNIEEALELYERALNFIKVEVPANQVMFHGFEGVFYPIALIISGMKGSQASQKDCFKRAHAYLNRVEKKGREFDFSKTISDIHQTFFLIEGQTGLAETIDHSLFQSEFQNYLIYFMSCLTWYWQGEKLSSQDEGELFTLMERAEESCYFWIAREAASLLLHFSSSNRYSEAFERFSKLCSPSVSLVDLIEPQSKWRKVLEALIGLDKKLPSVKKIAQPLKTRLVWDIEIFDEHNKYPLSDYYGDIYDYSDKLSITPREQKCGKNGQWSKGRNISLKTMMDKYHELDFITDQDRLLCRAIIKKKESHGYYSKRRRKEVYTFDFKKAVEALIGHPLLYATDNPSLRIEFVKKEPQLHVNQIEDGFSIYVVPEMDTGEPFLIEKETMTRFGVVFMTPELIETINILQSGVVVPASGKELVLKAVASIAPRLSVHTNVAGMAPGVKEVEADSRPYFNLVPYGEGLKGEILTKPFPDGGSFHRPGKGGKIVVTEINDLKVQAHRDLSLEESRAADVINKCPLLAHYDDEEDEWLITDPEDCLELLSELRELKDEVVVQWPKGEKIKVTGEVGGSAFTMRIQKDINWFAATGELKIDDKTVINLKQLLELSRKTYSRFMKMDDGTYLTLTKAFKKKLEEFDTFSVDHKDGVRFNPLASLALEGFTADLGKIMGDQHWKAHQKKFAEPKPVKVPNTLRATLRDYQVEGFQWLARLSHWEVGACLADDMGIGKTVQTLAAILLRASDGPTLVVAPTSVIMNWEDEANRFAPTLRVLCFHGGNRQELLSELKPFDLVVTSYGLLNSESEKLSAVKWQTVVLDEAQAIKNMATKRSKAAMELDARFRIVTTGTPIENHLGELWNLFQFINPGFLGSPENFNQVFASPIEKFRDVKAHGRLKKLIRPFILRRLKQDVLTELPPRTEITLHVEMSEAEAALYEAQRQYSLEKIEEAQGSEEGGNMQVLAELTRLRRFCCNPDLVVPNSGVGSSKLKMFGEIVGELLDNGHKALVFSQFVGHLTILREFLDDRKISCQYLDGSTSLNQRQQRIRDFQSGQGDIFLISLKAGGSGLNLTAADYVIHMDPWWNPAVEDQASDRAHRIGQLRPVTIYRLVVKDTIEEKILKLHGKKRDLATNLLEGSEMSGKISTKELLDLIKG